MRKLMSFLICIALLAPVCMGEGHIVAAGGEHALAVDTNGDVWAWGANGRAESVPGSAEQAVLAPVKVLSGAVSVAAGRQFSLALLQDGSLYGWGDNASGQLPGCALTRAETPVLIMENVASIDACENVATAVTKDGDAYAWGEGYTGLTPILSDVKKAAPALGCVLLLTNAGDAYFAGDGDYLSLAGDAETPVPVLTDVRDIDANGQTLMAVLRDGTVYVWGANGGDGRLGIPGANTWVTAPSAVAVPDGTPIAGLSVSGLIANDHRLYLWGTLYSLVTSYDADGYRTGAYVETTLLSYGGAPTELYGNVLDAAVGEAFVLIAYQDGSVYAWGSNGQGQIGDGGQTTYQMDDTDEDAELTLLTNAQRVFPSFVMTR